MILVNRGMQEYPSSYYENLNFLKYQVIDFINCIFRFCLNMGFLKIIKFSTKALICGGAVYYTNEFGIWGNTKETEEGYAKMKSTIQVSIHVPKVVICGII